MSERIIDVNIQNQSSEDMLGYAIYTARYRAVPSSIDGLKPVIRKILYCAAHDFRGNGFIKTAALMGQVIKSYSPHGDSSVQMAVRNMINDFSIKYPTMEGEGSWGTKSNPYPAAPRYNACRLSQFAKDVLLADIYEDKRSTDWMPNYDNKTVEPEYLPARIPTLLILGQMGIAVGLKVSIPSHNIGEVIDTTIKLIHNPTAKFCLVPDECMPCEILDTDWEKINETGRGTYIAQAIIDIGEYKGNPALYIKSLPDFTYYDSIKETIIKLVESKKMPYIQDLISKSKADLKSIENKTTFEEVIVLKKGTDPNFVKEFLYANTAMRQTRQVNIITIKDNKLCHMNYRQYLLEFIRVRRMSIARKLNARLQHYKTLIHERIPYLKLLNSKDCDKIIEMIRKQTGTEDKKLIDFLVGKLKITPLQASYLIDIKLKNLSKGYLMKCKKDVETYQTEAEIIMGTLLDPNSIDGLIISEMTYIKNKYNDKILRKIITKSEAIGIAPGTFKLVFTKRNFVKKIGENESIGSLGKDELNFSLIAENTENILVFSTLGKVFKIPVHKIPITDKTSNGIDIRILNKYCTSNICCAARESTLEKLSKSKYRNFIFIITNNGYIKKIDIDDILMAPPSGLIYSKIEDGDYVKSLLFGPDKMDLLIYSGNKVLRMSTKHVPYLKRSTKGNRASTASSKIDGMNFVLPNTTDIVIITESGMVNRLPIGIIQTSNRGKAGSKVIKLKKDDKIKSIQPCKENASIVVYEGNRSNTIIPLNEIPVGSTISMGNKLLKNPIRVAVTY